MPTDSKRLAVPEKSVPYQLYQTQREPGVEEGEIKKKTTTTKSTRLLLDENELRSDGRRAEEMRPIFIKTKAVSQAKGSAYLEIGKTKVMCSVFGPREVSKREDFSMTGAVCVEFKFATFSEKCRRSHQQDGQEKDLSLILQETLQPAILLHTFPKCQLDISITVLENGGSALSAAITAASLALIDAGVEMFDVVIGAAVLLSPQEKVEEETTTTTKEAKMTALVDPTSLEEFALSSPSSLYGLLVVGYMPSLNQIAGFHQTGVTTLDVFHGGMRTCLDAAKGTLPLVRKKIAEAAASSG